MSNDARDHTDPWAFAQPSDDPHDANHSVLPVHDFDRGMGLLSGAFDRGHIPAEQIQARNAATWALVNPFTAHVFAAAVKHLMESRLTVVKQDGTTWPPAFPAPGDIHVACRQIAFAAAQHRALPAPQIVPAPPEVARAHLAEIRERLTGSARATKGPLGSVLRAVVTDTEQGVG